MAKEPDPADDLFERMKVARAAIVEHAGPYRKGVSKFGAIDCPVCKKKNSLKYSRAGVNGHIHARCPGCVSWME